MPDNDHENPIEQESLPESSQSLEADTEKPRHRHITEKQFYKDM